MNVEILCSFQKFEKELEEEILYSKNAFVFSRQTSASDGSSPQVYVRLLAVDHRLERNVSPGLLESSLSKVCQSKVT